MKHRRAGFDTEAIDELMARAKSRLAAASISPWVDNDQSSVFYRELSRQTRSKARLFGKRGAVVDVSDGAAFAYSPDWEAKEAPATPATAQTPKSEVAVVVPRVKEVPIEVVVRKKPKPIWNKTWYVNAEDGVIVGDDMYNNIIGIIVSDGIVASDDIWTSIVGVYVEDAVAVRDSFTPPISIEDDPVFVSDSAVVSLLLTKSSSVLVGDRITIGNSPRPQQDLVRVSDHAVIAPSVPPRVSQLEVGDSLTVRVPRCFVHASSGIVVSDSGVVVITKSHIRASSAVATADTHSIWHTPPIYLEFVDEQSDVLVADSHVVQTFNYTNEYPLVNPGFENNVIDPWIEETQYCTTLSTQKHSGTYSARLYDNGAAMYLDLTNLVLNRSYRFQYWMRTPNSSSNAITLRIGTLGDPMPKPYINDLAPPAPANIWTRKEYSFVHTVAGTVRFRFGSVLFFQGISERFIDDLSLTST